VSATFDFSHVVDQANAGTFQVAQVKANAFWVENPVGVEADEGYTCSFYRFDSVMPGDTLTLTDLFGGNVGVYTVATAGSDLTKFTVTPPFPVVLTTAALSGRYPEFGVRGLTPARFVRRLESVYGNTAVVQAATASYDNTRHIIPGCTVSMLGRLGYDTYLHTGIDGYRYNTGLIGELNKVLYGDESDTAYPGVLAAGAQLNITGPYIKRLNLSLQVRAVAGADVVRAVQDAVTKVVNQSPIGTNIAISDIVSAANGVVGVESVAVVYPSYSALSDEIQLQPQEKALILSVADITVTVIGSN
jgi:hypothetical protein